MALSSDASNDSICLQLLDPAGPAYGWCRNFFNLPENVIIVALVPVGYPTKVPPLRPRIAMDEILLRPGFA